MHHYINVSQNRALKVLSKVFPTHKAQFPNGTGFLQSAVGKTIAFVMQCNAFVGKGR